METTVNCLIYSIGSKIKSMEYGYSDKDAVVYIRSQFVEVNGGDANA